jgi:GH24 family phage-related lysozyme (muramidase)
VGNIYFISRDGNSWMELHNDGFVDIYGNLDISIRSEASVNIRADLDVNIEAGNSVNIKANGEGGIKLQADIANIDLSSANYYCTVSEDLNLLAKNVFVESEEESHFKNREFLVKAETNINMRGDNQLRFASDANISFTTGQNINFDGTRVDSNTGSGDLPSDADAANPATKIKSKVFLDIDFDQIGGATEENLESCVSRLPRHEPWPDHAVSPGSERISPNPEETGEEPPINASVGSVAEKAARPLPVVGSPKKGMSPGIYEPVSYEGDQPVYRNTGNQGDLIPAKDRVISPQGIEFIKKEEGFAPRKYPDGGKNRFSIGYGHQITGREPFDPEKGWTKQQATQVLTQDLEKFQAAVRKAVTAKVTQNQFDALTSFAFNVGIGALQKSTLVKKLNEGNYQEVPNEFMKWVFSEGKRNQGLIKRRRKEALLFTTP